MYKSISNQEKRTHLEDNREAGITASIQDAVRALWLAITRGACKCTWVPAVSLTAARYTIVSYAQ